MTLKLKDWAYIAEIIGGVAIIASLIFVGLEIQENSRQVRSATFQSITELDMSWLDNMVENQDLSIAWNKLLIDHTKLQDIEWAQLDWVITMMMRNFENIYQQYQAGILPEERWSSSQNIINYTFSKGGMYCWYREADNPQLLTGDFREIMADAYNNSPLANQNIECPELPMFIED